MGGVFSGLWSLVSGQKTYNILLAGLEQGGKTTLVYKLKTGKVIQQTPTFGYNVDTVQYKDITLVITEAVVSEKMKDFWQHYISGKQGLVYMVNSTNRAFLEGNLWFVKWLINYPGLEDLPLLVLANMQDTRGCTCMSPSEIIKTLGMEKLKRPWAVKGTNIFNSQSIEEALDWLAQELAKKN